MRYVIAVIVAGLMTSHSITYVFDNYVNVSNNGIPMNSDYWPKTDLRADDPITPADLTRYKCTLMDGYES
jgi:hypothetical protein